MALERGGYRVILAESGGEAITVLSESQERIALVVLDWTVRDMHGVQVVSDMKKLQPDLKILLTSGYDRATVLARAPRNSIDDFLQKPYLPKLLTQRVGQVLGAVPSSQAAGTRAW